ncbi:(2Fe-2S)-binding protein [Vibrio splendidus]
MSRQVGSSSCCLSYFLPSAFYCSAKNVWRSGRA